MKYLKILGLAAIAAFALTAIIGAGTASASTLCKTTVQECPPEWDWPKGTEIHASLAPETSAVLEVSGIPENTCLKSTVKGKTTNTGSSTETVDGEISELTFEECIDVTKVIKGGLLEIHADEPDTNTAGVLTSKNAEVTVALKGLGISCIAKTGSAGVNLGTIDEPSSPTSDARMTVNATIPLSGFLCPSTSKWTAEYVVTSPTPLYVSTA